MGAAALDLFAHRSRSLRLINVDGRAAELRRALHHARTALAAAGYDVVVDGFPDPTDADLLAGLCLCGGRV
ncbi:MAG TPA: hypothetical protein VFY84_04730 [Jiangellales bacterium]|nr:hypothetical protein [Jiangellales bacterium]